MDEPENDNPEKLDESLQKPLISARKSSPCPYCAGEGRLLVDIDSGFPVYNLFGHWQYHCLSCQQEFSVDYYGYVME